METKSVFRRLRIADHSVIANEILNEYFEKTEKGFFHARCTKEIKNFKKKTQTNRINGAKGGRPRKNAASSKTQSVSDGLQSAIPKETQTEPKDNPNQEPLTTNQELIKKESKPKKASAFPHSKIVEIYNEKCERLSKVQSITDKRRKAMKSLAAKHKKFYDLETWENYFDTVNSIDFLNGSNDRNWRADFDWLLNESNMVKIAEGKYQ